MTNRRILFSVTTPITAIKFLQGQLTYLREQGWEPHLLSSPSPDLAAFCQEEETQLHPVAMTRAPNPLADLRSLFKSLKVIHALQPSMIIAGTPKAALITLAAARIANVRRRIYLVHGLRFEGSHGARRSALIAFEKVTSWCSTEIVCVSQSVKAALVAERIAATNDVHVLGFGSPNGVDTTKFSQTDQSKRQTARDSLNLPHNAQVALFVGRLTRDKGIADLRYIADSFSAGQLLVVVGDPEVLDNCDAHHLTALRNNPNTRVFSHTDNIERFYAAADVLILPTRREGLPTVVLEASACGLPTVAYHVTGVLDVIKNGITGITVPAQDREALVASTQKLLSNGPLRKALGARAQTDITNRFSQETVWENWSNFLGSR